MPHLFSCVNGSNVHSRFPRRPPKAQGLCQTIQGLCGHQPWSLCCMLQKGQYGGVLELPRRQPRDLVFQVYSSVSLSALYLYPELFSGVTGQRGTQGPGMAILGTFRERSFWDSSYYGLRASSSKLTAVIGQGRHSQGTRVTE